MKAGPPRQIKLQDPMQIETPRAELEAAASVSLGAAYKLDKKRSKRAKWLVFRIVKDGQDQEPELGPREALEKRISAGARGVLGRRRRFRWNGIPRIGSRTIWCPWTSPGSTGPRSRCRASGIRCSRGCAHVCRMAASRRMLIRRAIGSGSLAPSRCPSWCFPGPSGPADPHA